MTAYAFGTGRFEGDNGSKGTLHDVTLDFDQKLETRPYGDRVALADGELCVTGLAKEIIISEGIMPKTGQVYFLTTTSNFCVAREVEIKLNNCLFKANGFEARADKQGKVFTLSMKEGK